MLANNIKNRIDNNFVSSIRPYKHFMKQRIICSIASLSDVLKPNYKRYGVVSHTFGSQRISEALKGDFHNVGQYIEKATRELQPK